MARKAKHISDPTVGVAQQGLLFALPGTTANPNNPFPPIQNSSEALKAIVAEAAAEGKIGTDLEFHPDSGRPTIIGVSSRARTGAIPWDSEIAAYTLDTARRTNATLVGHSVIGADKPVYEGALGVKTGLELWDDSMIAHYLNNSDLCKAPGKDEDDDDTGALGFMNLWTAASLTTDLPQWKICRGPRCEGPCPSHHPLDYCAIDSWAGLQIQYQCEQELAQKKVPHGLYRDLIELSDITERMKARGIAVDKAYVEDLEKNFDEKKFELFPYDLVGNKKIFRDYNPASGQQIKKFFSENFNLGFDATDKASIADVLKKQAKDKARIVAPDIKTLIRMLEEEDELPPVVEQLFKLYSFKAAGKGLKSWFDGRYFGADGFLHPRWIITGTSTGRLASSGPNFQNIPARGFGALVRRAIIARLVDHDIVKCDFSQMELRMCVVPDTKILTTDMRWRRADEIAVGDELIGFDENQQNGRSGVRYRRSRVLACGRVSKPTITLQTSKGNITGADDHYLVVMRPNHKCGFTRTWVMMKDIQPGDRLPFTTQPWETEHSRDAGYLAGMFDGEGWLTKSSVGFAQAAGLVADNVQRLLAERKYEVASWTAQRHQNHTKPHIKAIITSGMWETARFLGTIRPQRLLAKSSCVWENRRAWGGKNTSYAKVHAVIPGPVQELCAITTTTRTYIANGFFSHNCLYLAGLDPTTIGADAFQWLVEQSNGAFAQAAAMLDDTERQAAKSVSHAFNYLEGFKWLPPADLQKANIQAQIRAGALRVYTRKYTPRLKEDWEYRNGIVAFTGANLAERLFGDRTYANRKKALEIQEDILAANFPMLRNWHWSVLQQVQERRAIQSPTGRYLPLYGSPEDDAKMAAAFLGQGTSADHVQGIMLRFNRELNLLPYNQVHDELDWEMPRSLTDAQAAERLMIMTEESPRLPGFRCALKMKRGDSWLEDSMRQIYPLKKK